MSSIFVKKVVRSNPSTKKPDTKLANCYLEKFVFKVILPSTNSTQSNDWHNYQQMSWRRHNENLHCGDQFLVFCQNCFLVITFEPQMLDG